jgi:SAM-dependent methyltransferase
MDGCDCGDVFASIFDRETAEHDRERYRRDGPDRTTVTLVDMLRARGLADATVLDIGGGTGVLTRALLAEGASAAVLVDGSPAFITVAREEAVEAGVEDRVELVRGDFVAVAPRVGEADVVTLDRVICCYGNVEALVSLSAERARRLYGLVLPRDGLPTRLAIWLNNLRFMVTRSPYRSYVHRNRRVDAIAAEHGLRPVAEDRTLFWRVVLYARST